MTIVAGAFSRHAGDPLPVSLCNALRTHLSRDPNEQTEEFRDGRCFMVKVDIGAYREPALRVYANAVSFLVGEPLLDQAGKAAKPRSSDLIELHDDFVNGETGALRRARGIFAAAHYDRQSGRLRLATDKLGLRPMYYFVGDRYIIFASALRILEHVREVPKQMDVRGVTELYALEYPLADRTPFAAVKLMKGGEVLDVNDVQSNVSFYWHWDDIKESGKPLEELTKECHAEFMTAVKLRNGADGSTASFLSGGLDSRSIVMALVQLGLRVHTFNFSIAETQDQALGAEFARRVGTIHHERPRQHGRQVSAMMAETWTELIDANPKLAERPQIVWSGGGGSVALGHIYLTRAMVQLARNGDIDGALELYSQACASAVPTRLLKSDLRDELQRVANEGMARELEDLANVADPGRRLYLFLMLNDQRRRTAEHFEEIDLGRLEYHLPFFDSEFVVSVLRVPIDACLEHHFYMKWLALFPDVALSVAWQAYPGHEPCPLPIQGDLTSQWEDAEKKRVRKSQRSNLLSQAKKLLRTSDFPDPILKKESLLLATVIFRLGLRDVGHVIKAASVYHRYWSQCDGSYMLPTVTRRADATVQ